MQCDLATTAAMAGRPRQWPYTFPAHRAERAPPLERTRPARTTRFSTRLTRSPQAASADSGDACSCVTFNARANIPSTRASNLPAPNKARAARASTHQGAAAKAGEHPAGVQGRRSNAWHRRAPTPGACRPTTPKSPTRYELSARPKNVTQIAGMARLAPRRRSLAVGAPNPRTPLDNCPVEYAWCLTDGFEHRRTLETAQRGVVCGGTDAKAGDGDTWPLSKKFSVACLTTRCIGGEIDDLGPDPQAGPPMAADTSMLSERWILIAHTHTRRGSSVWVPIGG